ncbi:hypothetical protein DACRYDRAFT_50428 [Dacryopinax primogenitus]|uniref:Hsp90 chaperone protein kinase-targeting subunit n=1 Tax=Dacryopinax primogenitus (strain DJM 731) TaxID=1858805 RepID=M5FZ92_DACPD|nr:uncharacterized protein DACRYDRAFT_50428 [Dacryopinax primogenitus]EJU03366.1 hypothetical protein DACRYDRAFT_50428 [Dacryopinax primogenitus]
MPLNYSKWDKLELSDDSDIEGHPNVDKKSLIRRWKQRDIHEKREARKHKIAQLGEEIKTSNIILPRISALISAVSTNGPKEFSSLTERLKKQPSPDGPAPYPGAPKAPSYDQMMESLLYKVWEDVREKGTDVKDEQSLETALVKELNVHEAELGKRVKECEEELQALNEEAHAKITSDDIHEGFDSHYLPHKVEDVEIAPSQAAPKHKKTHKTTETSFETLNSPKPMAPIATPKDAPTPVPNQEEKSGYEADEPGEDDDEDDDDDDELPALSPALLKFSRIGVGKYDESYHFLQENNSVLAAGALDALFGAAYLAEMRNDTKYAKSCVHQALLLQYCEKLGKDGIAVFFRRMASGHQNAQAVFMKDVNDTYGLMKQRVAANRASASQGKETIQLQVESGVNSISFNIPDGPPPPPGQALEVNYEGLEEGERPDVEEVRMWLQKRWDIWQGFPKKLRKALQSGSLENVNKVLEGMEVEPAEKIVQQLQEGGILNFSESGVRDETPAGKAARGETGEAPAKA